MNATVLSQTWKRDAGSVTGLDLGIGAKRLLTGATFTIGVGDHVALLGRNGCGKSTLFGWIRTADGPDLASRFGRRRVGIGGLSGLADRPDHSLHAD